jgi:hypothetical protein
MTRIATLSLMDERTLTETERLVWAAFPAGERVDLGSLPDREVRAEVIRALLLGACPGVPGRQAGLRLAGAVVTGRITLPYTDVNASLSIRDSRILEAPDLYGARLRRVTLAGSEMPGLNLAAAEIAAGLHLTGSVVTGPVALIGTQIGGGVTLDGARFSGAPVAINATQLTVARDVLARDGFTCEGEICLDGADVKGSIRLKGSRLASPGGWALNGPGLRVGAVLDLSGDTQITGGVRLSNASVGSVLSLSRAVLTEPGRRALDLRSMTAGEVILRPAAPLPGPVDLGYARVGLLRDSAATWPRSIDLDGFVYEAIDGPLPVAERLAWLERDPGAYRPQSYRRLAALYRSAGRDDDARQVLLAGERRGRKTLPRTGRLWSWLQDRRSATDTSRAERRSGCSRCSGSAGRSSGRCRPGRPRRRRHPSSMPWPTPSTCCFRWWTWGSSPPTCRGAGRPGSRTC